MEGSGEAPLEPGAAGDAGSRLAAQLPAVLAALLEATTDPVFSLDREGRYTSFNAAHAAAMKALYGADIRVGHDLFAYQTVAADNAAARANIERALAGETVVAAAFAGDDARTRRCFELTHVPVREGEAVTGVLVTARDVTERRRDLAAARVHERALEASINAIALADMEWRITYVNPAFLTLWGCASASEVVGRRAGEFWASPADVAAVREALHSSGGWAGELSGARVDGSTFVADVVTSLVTDDDGSAIGSIAAVSDISERRQTEAALRESETRLRSILENLQDAYLRSGPDGRLTFVSNSAAAMFGYDSADQMIGVPAADLYADAGAREELLGRLREHGRLHDLRLRGVRRDGSTFWTAMSVQLALGDDGAFLGTEGLVRDVTEREGAEQALREGEQRLLELARQSRTWAWEVDADGLYTFAGPVVQDVLGFRPEELVGVRHFYDLCPEGSREELKEAGLAAFARKEPFVGLENSAVTADGRTVWLSTNGIPVLGDDGRLLGYRGADTDVTVRRRAEAELRRFRKMVDQANYGAATATRDGTLVYVNEAMAAMHGWTVDELTGRHLTVCHSEGQMPRVREMLELIARDGAFTAQEVWHARRDGSEFPALMNAFAIEGLDGEPALQAVSMVDISDLKQAEDQIRRLNADLERRVRERTADLHAANKEIEAFSYSVSHDLRQPLRAIDGFCQILWEDEHDRLSENGRADLERVRAAAQKMARLIDDLLSLSRLSRRDVLVDDVDVSAMVADILAGLRESDPGRCVETVVAPGCVARTDAGLLDVVVANLLHNAWKFTSIRPAARIEFGRVEDDGALVLFVRDDGAGFEPAYAEKLFRPFSRLHHEAEFPGNGIGLATVQRAVARLGGRCWAEGAVDGGATFYFTLGEPED